MNCNIIEIGGQKNGYFTRNIFIDSKDLKSSIKQFDGDIYSTIYIIYINIKLLMKLYLLINYVYVSSNVYK